MLRPTQITIPTLVRIKEGALDRLGHYLQRCGHQHVAILSSQGLPTAITGRVLRSLSDQSLPAPHWVEIDSHGIEDAAQCFAEIPKGVTAIVGLGGGKALDVGKYVAFLGRVPYFAVPTSLSNDGFCSPQSSLTMRGRRRSLPAAVPYGVVVDTGVCREAPRILTLSGIGDLVSKFTAVRDWKLAFHATGEVVNDFAGLISDGSIYAFLNHPRFDATGFQLLATSLLLNGVAMEICGSSRPASGSEHLISHALDALSARPRLHGLQVGVATYLCSLLQRKNSDTVAQLFDSTGFWKAIAEDPFSRREWMDAVRSAPSIKEGYYTVLSSRDVLPEVERFLRDDPWLAPCFRN